MNEPGQKKAFNTMNSNENALEAQPEALRSAAPRQRSFAELMGLLCEHASAAPSEPPAAAPQVPAPDAADPHAENTRPKRKLADLKADRDQVERYLKLGFRNLKGAGGYTIIQTNRVPLEGASRMEYPLEGRSHMLTAPIVDIATRHIDAELDEFRRREAAGAPRVFPNFFPVMGLFTRPGDATRDNLFANPVIIVELDAHPSVGREKIEAALGKPSFVVESGGICKETGEPKVHLYWRLKTPAMRGADGDTTQLDTLYAVREAAAKVAGSDISAKSIVQAMRAPGSWHLKNPDSPRPVRIVEVNEDRDDITLEAAAELLKVDPAALAAEAEARKAQKGIDEADADAPEDIKAAREYWAERIAADRLHAKTRGADGEALPGEKTGSDTFATHEAMKLRDLGLSEDTAAEVLYETYGEHMGFDKEWIETKTRNGYSSAKNKFGCRSQRAVAKEVQALVEKWLDVIEDPEEDREDAERERAKAEPGIVTGLVDASKIPVRRWLVEPRLPLGNVCLCVGEPNISKSTLALRDALVVATGREDILRGRSAAGRPISPERLYRTGAVLIYNAEDDYAEMERRLAAAQRYYGVSDSDMKHPIILWSGVDHEYMVIMQRTEARGPFKRGRGLASLEARLRKHQVIFAVLDPQASLVRGGAEDTEDMEVLYQELARLASRTGCSVQVAQHTSKNSRDNAGDLGAGRGAISAVAKVRFAYTLTKVLGTRADEAKWNLDGEEEGSLFRLDYSKASHSKRTRTPIVFRRRSAPVGNGSGVRPEAASALFDQNPQAALEAAGDQAPVLDLIDLAALMTAGKPRDEAEAIKIAEIADSLMGEINEVKLPDLWGAIGVRMRDAGLSTAKSRQDITGNIVSALAGGGVKIQRGGQAVLIQAKKTSSSNTAPWLIVRTVQGVEGVET